eukprot:6492686-Amphidinium_carterae.2
MDRQHLTGLGKASMPKTSHPRFSFWGWGWFKSSWLKAPGPPAVHLYQQGTAGAALLRPPAFNRLVTAGKKHQCHGVCHWIMLCVSLQPFEHRPCDDQTCRSLSAALPCSPDVAPCGRTSGTTCTLFPFLGDVGCSLQFVPAAVMRKYFQQQCRPQRAWKTGDDENVCCFTTWPRSPTQITILGLSWVTGHLFPNP